MKQREERGELVVLLLKFIIVFGQIEIHIPLNCVLRDLRCTKCSPCGGSVVQVHN